jgi:hypothetical protein
VEQGSGAAGEAGRGGVEHAPRPAAWVAAARLCVAVGPGVGVGLPGRRHEQASGMESSRSTPPLPHRPPGKLPTLRVRAVCKQPDGTPLIEAAARQLVFDTRDEEGDLVGAARSGRAAWRRAGPAAVRPVTAPRANSRAARPPGRAAPGCPPPPQVGFWCPPYSGPGIQVPGFHLHYLSADKQRGGHVLQLSLAPGATARWIEVRGGAGVRRRRAGARGRRRRLLQRPVAAARLAGRRACTLGPCRTCSR